MSYPFIASPNFSSGRPSGVRFFVVHTMETPEDANRAHSTAANWFAKPSASVSAHFCGDNKETIRCVYDEDQAWQAGAHGNLWGVGYEIAGRASQGVSGWRDAYSLAALELCAQAAAVTCKKWGLPVQHITAAQLRQGAKGICGHADVHQAWPQDTTHTDPGPDFPWAYFIGRVQNYYKGGTNSAAQEDISIVDAATKSYMDANFAAIRGTMWDMFVALSNGTARVDNALGTSLKAGQPYGAGNLKGIMSEASTAAAAAEKAATGNVDTAAVSKAVADDLAKRLSA